MTNSFSQMYNTLREACQIIDPPSNVSAVENTTGFFSKIYSWIYLFFSKIYDSFGYLIDPQVLMKFFYCISTMITAIILLLAIIKIICSYTDSSFKIIRTIQSAFSRAVYYLFGLNVEICRIFQSVFLKLAFYKNLIFCIISSILILILKRPSLTSFIIWAIGYLDLLLDVRLSLLFSFI
jgi:hypothetical protein